MFLLFGFLALLGISYGCWWGARAFVRKNSMASQDWLRKKLIDDRRFSQADQSSVLDESALAFDAGAQKIYLASKEPLRSQSSEKPRRHKGWKFAVDEYEFADFVDVEEVDNDFERPHITLCSKVGGQDVQLPYGHKELVRVLRPLLIGR